MRKAEVFDVALQDQVYDKLSQFKPRPSIYDPDFIAANQKARAKNTIDGTKYEQYLQIRQDIRDFRSKSGVDKVIIMWTANTERFAAVEKGLNDTAEALEASLMSNHSEISPSTIFAMASIAEGCTYINGSPQNTFVPGVIELAERHNIFIAGDDFKSGQTKVKSVLVDFLVGAGIKPVSIVSYNHLGNNDGKNLSAPQQFRSKEVHLHLDACFSSTIIIIFVLFPRRFRRVTWSMIWFDRITFCMQKMSIPITLLSSNTYRMWVIASVPWTNTPAKS